MENNHFFYVLLCGDGSFYAGYTNDLDKRVKVHNEGKGGKYTRARLPVSLLHSEKYPTKREAMQMEYYFKTFSRKKKERYLESRRETVSE